MKYKFPMLNSSNRVFPEKMIFLGNLLKKYNSQLLGDYAILSPYQSIDLDFSTKNQALHDERKLWKTLKCIVL
jgi:hypothetical protein